MFRLRGDDEINKFHLSEDQRQNDTRFNDFCGHQTLITHTIVLAVRKKLKPKNTGNLSQILKDVVLNSETVRHPTR